MPARICPYLGQTGDSDTALEFPSSANSCHHANPVAPVRLAHQRQFCLHSAHNACPVYQRAGLAPLPPEIAARPQRTIASLWPVGALLALVALAAVLFSGLPRSLAMIERPSETAGSLIATATSLPATSTQMVIASLTAPPNTPQPSVSRTAARTATARPSATRAPTEDPAGIPFWTGLTSTPNPTRASCPQPGGWTLYVVKPTDSLLRLSQLYSVSLEELVEKNCLPSQTVRPGESIFVPAIATLTPYIPPTRTPTVRVYFPTLNLGPTNPPPPPATAVPPTAVPPTAVPPTAPAPITDTPAPPPPPTQEPTLPPPPTLP